MDLSKQMYFRRSGINYEIIFSKDNKKRKQGIFGNQIQIQFNDLVGLEVNKLKEAEEPKVDSSKFISKSGIVLQSKLVADEWFFEDVDSKQIYKFDTRKYGAQIAKLIKETKKLDTPIRFSGDVSVDTIQNTFVVQNVRLIEKN